MLVWLVDFSYRDNLSYRDHIIILWAKSATHKCLYYYNSYNRVIIGLTILQMLMLNERAGDKSGDNFFDNSNSGID